MAILVPGAEAYILTNPVSTRRIVRLWWLLCHTIVGTVNGALSGKHYHLYVRANGAFIQRQDLALRSAASVQANPYSIAIVCEDKGPAFPNWTGSNVPPYTPQQVATLIMILSWICHRFGLSRRALRTTCLNTEGEGIGWHRLGIDGDFPNVWPYWGRRPGCLETSLSTGKPCPGNARITQLVNDIIPRVSTPVPEDPLAAFTEADLNRIMRDAVADEMETPGSRSRTALDKLWSQSLESKAGRLHQAADTWADDRESTPTE